MIALMRRSAAQARYVLLGSFALLFGVQLVIIGQAAEVERTHSFSRMAELLPGFLQRGLGSRAMLLASFKGTVAFGYFHPVVCLLLSVLAIYVMTEPAHEVEAGLVDLELARSVPRHWLLTRSVALMAGSILVAVSVMALGTYAGGRVFAAGSFDLPSAGICARLLVHVAGVAACCGSFGLLLAVWSRRWMTAFTTAALVTVVTYLIDFLSIGWRPMRAVAWISPFHYYPALSILAGDAPNAQNLTVLYATALLFTGLAYWRWQRRDL